MEITSLHAMIAAIAPIDGVSVGRWGDRASWRIDFKDEATPEQRVAAQDALAAFDVNAEPAADRLRDPFAEIDALKAQIAKLTSGK